MKRAYLSFWTILLICFLSSNVFAVSEAALLFLLISPSPRANGMGTTYMALPANDAYAVIFNPGYLGVFAMENYVSVGVYPHSVQWLPGFTDDLFYNSKAANIGFKLNKYIFAGIGYHKIYLDLGEQVITREQSPEPIGYFHSWEKARALSMGIGGHFGVKIGLGMSVKYAESQLGVMKSGAEYETTKADIFAYDFGGILQIPVFEMLNTSINLPFSNKLTLIPLLVPSLGYSIGNYGGEISYIDPAQADPIPRVARVGYSIDSGISLGRKNSRWKLVSFKWAREAEDLLVKREPPDYEIKYQTGLGDIDFCHDLIEWKPNPIIIKKEGWEINCLETFYFREGEYNDPEGKVIYQTTGYGVGIAGLFQLASILFPTNESIKFFANHVDVQYHWSEMETAAGHPLEGTKFKGINLVIR